MIYIPDWVEDMITKKYLDRDNKAPYDNTDDQVDEILYDNKEQENGH